MTYQAPLLALSLIATMLYRNFLYKFEMKKMKDPDDADKMITVPTGTKLPLFVHYYVPLYIGFAVLTGLAIQGTFKEMQQTKWLDKDLVRGQFPDDDWKVAEKLVDLSGFGWLTTFSFSAPFWTLCTVVCCFLHTMQHVMQIKGSKSPFLGSVSGQLHDHTIQILALPAIYGLMSMKSVVRVWETLANTDIGVGYESWAARSEFLTSMYETNFMVADLYESWALYQFAELALAILGKGFKKREHDLKGMEEQEKKLAKADGKVSKQEAMFETGLEATLHDYIYLAESVEQLTVQGIYSFIVTCFVQSTWALISTTLAYEGELSNEKQESILAAADKIKFFFLGMGTVASSAAISNIIVLEESFGDRLKQAHFFPSAKFWGTKILVSLAFLQSLILYLPPFNSWTANQQNLLYSSALCLECFLVALLHLMAWPHKEAWYGDELEVDEKKQSLLA